MEALLSILDVTTAITVPIRVLAELIPILVKPLSWRAETC